MPHQWPYSDDDARLDQALRLAMDYLELKGFRGDHPIVQKYLTMLIVKEWEKGARHPLRLSNAAISAVEALIESHAEETV
jgi:hypothetical protein